MMTWALPLWVFLCHYLQIELVAGLLVLTVPAPPSIACLIWLLHSSHLSLPFPSSIRLSCNYSPTVTGSITQAPGLISSDNVKCHLPPSAQPFAGAAVAVAMTGIIKPVIKSVTNEIATIIIAKKDVATRESVVLSRVIPLLKLACGYAGDIAVTTGSALSQPESDQAELHRTALTTIRVVGDIIAKVRTALCQPSIHCNLLSPTLFLALRRVDVSVADSATLLLEWMYGDVCIVLQKPSPFSQASPHPR